MGMHLNPLTWQLWGYVVLAWLMCMVVLSDLLEHRIHTTMLSTYSAIPLRTTGTVTATTHCFQMGE